MVQQQTNKVVGNLASLYECSALRFLNIYGMRSLEPDPVPERAPNPIAGAICKKPDMFKRLKKALKRCKITH